MLLRHILELSKPTPSTIEWVLDEIQLHMLSVRVALESMHQDMVYASGTRRRAARERRARRQGAKLHKSSNEDFVFSTTAGSRSGNKLALVWHGPKLIDRAVNDYASDVQDLAAPFKIWTRHTSRLQLDSDTSRSRVEKLIEQAAFGLWGLFAEALLAYHVSIDTHRSKVRVKWLGLDEIEVS